jgi:N-acetylglucosaminyldiphosphoundecaprenol N-acetyl-beta-D-mannosaminyltransferase
MKENLPTVRLFGVPFCKLGMDDTVRLLTETILESGPARKPHQVITANPIMIMTALERPDYMAIMKNADLIVPDGAGAVWAARYVGNPVAERVPGFDLMHRLLKSGEAWGWRVYLLGAAPETIREAHRRLAGAFPGIRFVGCRDGYFGEEEDDAVIAEIRAAEPDLLFVGRSADKQEPWIARHKERLGVPVMMGVGGSFDVIAGKLKRAPASWQRMRLEWLYRLLQEPSRYKRMYALPKFAWKVIRHRGDVQRDIW